MCTAPLPLDVNPIAVDKYISYEYWEARTTFTPCPKHNAKLPTIRKSAHRKPTTVFFNSSSGTAMIEAVNVQHVSIFGTCEDVRHLAHPSYNVTINSHNSQSTLHTDSHASYTGTVQRGWRTILGAKPQFLYLYMYIYSFLLKMTNISQNTDISSWDTLYNL
jgi:hypothetical protein